MVKLIIQLLLMIRILHEDSGMRLSKVVKDQLKLSVLLADKQGRILEI